MNGGGKTLGVNFRWGGGKDRIDAFIRQQGKISLFGAWIAPEVFMGRKLLGVDENGGDNAVRPPKSLADQLQMAQVKCTHRRHDGAGQTLGAPCGRFTAQGFKRAKDLWWHGDLNTHAFNFHTCQFS